MSKPFQIPYQSPILDLPLDLEGGWWFWQCASQVVGHIHIYPEGNFILTKGRQMKSDCSWPFPTPEMSTSHNLLCDDQCALCRCLWLPGWKKGSNPSSFSLMNSEVIRLAAHLYLTNFINPQWSPCGVSSCGEFQMGRHTPRASSAAWWGRPWWGGWRPRCRGPRPPPGCLPDPLLGGRQRGAPRD